MNWSPSPTIQYYRNQASSMDKTETHLQAGIDPSSMMQHRKSRRIFPARKRFFRRYPRQGYSRKQQNRIPALFCRSLFCPLKEKGVFPLPVSRGNTGALLATVSAPDAKDVFLDNCGHSIFLAIWPDSLGFESPPFLTRPMLSELLKTLLFSGAVFIMALAAFPFL